MDGYLWLWWALVRRAARGLVARGELKGSQILFLKNWCLSMFLGIAVCVLNGCGLTPFVKPDLRPYTFSELIA